MSTHYCIWLHVASECAATHSDATWSIAIAWVPLERETASGELAPPHRLEVDEVQLPVGDRPIGLVVAPPHGIPGQGLIALKAAPGAGRGDLDATEAHREVRWRDQP